MISAVFFGKILCSSLEIGFSLFDSFVVVNSYIAWKNHILKGRSEKERGWLKYGMWEARLQLITKWSKRCSRHYQRTKPHKKKRQRMVTSKRSQILNLLGWKAHPSSQTHCIMKNLYKCQSAQDLASYVVLKRSYVVRGAVWVYREYFLCAQLQSVTASNKCTGSETKYRYLNSILWKRNFNLFLLDIEDLFVYFAVYIKIYSFFHCVDCTFSSLEFAIIDISS